MPKVLRNTLLSARDLLATAGPFIVLALLLLTLAYVLLDPSPPRRVVLATGVEQGAYHEFGKRYARQMLELQKRLPAPDSKKKSFAQAPTAFLTSFNF